MPLHGRNDWFHTHCACAVHRHNHSSATHPPLGVNATLVWGILRPPCFLCFNGHPPLGVNATFVQTTTKTAERQSRRFNGHPPLGVNATLYRIHTGSRSKRRFQWAPTLGGECYANLKCEHSVYPATAFQWAPTLGGECYAQLLPRLLRQKHHSVSMGTHPWG